MTRRWMWVVAVAVVAGACAGQARAQDANQDRGYWEAASQNAREITGDLTISEMKLSINFAKFTIAQIRQVTAAEATALFGAQASAGGGGNLYRLEIPAEKKFAHHNTLCGEQETQWMATWSDGRTLQVAFFSGAEMPALTEQALGQAGSVCELLGYVR